MTPDTLENIQNETAKFARSLLKGAPSQNLDYLIGYKCFHVIEPGRDLTRQVTSPDLKLRLMRTIEGKQVFDEFEHMVRIVAARGAYQACVKTLEEFFDGYGAFMHLERAVGGIWFVLTDQEINPLVFKLTTACSIEEVNIDLHTFVRAEQGF